MGCITTWFGRVNNSCNEWTPSCSLVSSSHKTHTMQPKILVQHKHTSFSGHNPNDCNLHSPSDTCDNVFSCGNKNPHSTFGLKRDSLSHTHFISLHHSLLFQAHLCSVFLHLYFDFITLLVKELHCSMLGNKIHKIHIHHAFIIYLFRSDSKQKR